MTATHPDTPADAALDVKSRARRPQTAPESISQARTWDRVKHQVMRLGICEKCAAQYAWGVQIGFTLSHPPCGACTQVVAQHGGRTRPNGWRTLHRVTPFAGPVST